MQKRVCKNFKSLRGTIEIPPDKSLSHRAIMFCSLAKGQSIIRNFSDGADPHSTLKIFKQLGIDIIEQDKSTVIINSSGSLQAPAIPLDCGNSGTTMRLMCGILAGQKFTASIIGDESLSKRPMKRVIEPLTLMGARISSNDYKAPLKITGSELHAINYESPIASAQVKSCILLAGLGVSTGTTSFTEPYISRNHTEIMLKHMGAEINISETTVYIKKSELSPLNIEICGDISSAAYFIAAALIVPGSDLILKNVGLNPTRTGILEVLRQMGGTFEILDEKIICGEKVGDIRIKYSKLKGCTICGEIIPKLIDEIPIIAVIASLAEGKTIIKDAQDLRNKESDRISAVVKELKKVGANIHETADGMIINGVKELTGNCQVETYHDHRLAMSLYVAGLVCKKEILINEFEWVNISFPTFEKLFTNIQSV